MNQIFDDIRFELQNLTYNELCHTAQNDYGLDWVTKSTEVGVIIDACIAVEQTNFFS